MIFRKKTNGKMVREKLIQEADDNSFPRFTEDVEVKAEVAEEEQATGTKATKRILSRVTGSPASQERKPLLDFALFKNFAFCTLCLQIFLFTLSISISSLFLPALAQERGVSSIRAAYLVSILGICDGTCRIIISTILDLKRVKPYRLFVYNCVMFLTAIVFFLLPSMTSFPQLAVTCGLYGMLSGTYISQKSVIVVDVLGVANLSSSFGFLMLAQGLSNLIGSTVGGRLR